MFAFLKSSVGVRYIMSIAVSFEVTICKYFMSGQKTFNFCVDHFNI